MPSFYFKNEAPFANGVDVKRLARQIKQLLAEAEGSSTMTSEDALEVASKFLGARSYFDLRKQASDPNIRSWNHEDVERLVQEGAVSNGYDFPKELPKRFDKRWQRSVEKMVEEAISSRKPGSLEFIALVGGTGTGKTLVANRMCAKRSGRVIDVEISLQRGRQFSYAPGSVLALDRSAVSPPERTKDILSAWTQTPSSKQTLTTYRELRRTVFPAIPGDDAGTPNSLRHWVRENPNVTLIISFADRRQVENALRNSPMALSPGNPARSASLNWRRAHVVDLDAMNTYVVDNPAIEVD